ncbi:cobalt ECF transporter T component CbiQ [Fusibacter bizertensis]
MKWIALSYFFVTIVTIFINTPLYKRHDHSHGKPSSHQHKRRVKHQHGESLSIDFYAYASHIKAWHPVFKFELSISLLILCITVNTPYVSLIILATTTLIVTVLGGLSLWDYFAVLTIPMSFVLMSLLTISVDFSKFGVSEPSLYVGIGYLYTSKKLLLEGGVLGLKIIAAISSLQMLALTTPSSEIIMVLRRCKLPKLIIELMNMIYRFIFILLEVSSKMKNAAEARNGYVDFITACRTFSKIASNLLILSIKKANNYYDAMEARCYEGDFLFLEESYTINFKQIFFAVILIVFVITTWFFTKS